MKNRYIQIFSCLIALLLFTTSPACELDDEINFRKHTRVTTATVTQITESSAVAGGNVTGDGNASVTERGVCIATVTNPTTSNSKVSAGSGTGSFTCNLTNLQPNTTYYVRAYAVNSQGTAYGEEVSFTTKVEVVNNPSSNLRAMPFSVSESKQVCFSKGNLQYHPANDEWRFAESQLDYIGDANSNCSSTYNGWLDLFGWSTSSTNFGVSTSIDYNDYSGSFVDWGTNLIGADAPNTWRTLTYYEWSYLRYDRTNANDLVGVAQVNGVNGLILLPDNWTCPAGVTFKLGFHSEWGVDYYAAYQTFTAEQWSKLEAAGAVFLPAEGYRDGSFVYNVQNGGHYWSATGYDGDRAYYLDFYSDAAYMNDNYRDYGLSVRLVKDLQQETVKSLPSVTTATVTQITETTAVAGGNVTSDGGASVTERGVVYSTNPNPVITNLSNTILPCGSGAGSFTCNLTGLQPNTTYYIRAYAKNDVGTAYGEEMSFTTQTQIEKPTSPYFSVSQTKYITFSPGNLQYTQSTNIWSFAENQWDMIGTDNVTGGSVSSDSKYGDSKDGTALADKVDLFGWSTSATNFGVSTSTDWENDYLGSFVDWGTNQIGADAPNTWRTLTSEEWNYLRNTRTNASSLKGVAQVDGVNGLIFLPDNWVCPAGVTFKSGFHSSYGVDYYAAYQTFTADQWSMLEAAGAVFLPAAGVRNGSDVLSVQYCGYYWSATEDNSYIADCVDFYSCYTGMNIGSRYGGQSVRLVKDL